MVVHRQVIGHLGTGGSRMELEIHTPFGPLLVQVSDTEIKVQTHGLQGYIRSWATTCDDHGSIGTITILSDSPTITLRPELTREELNYMLNSPVTDELRSLLLEKLEQLESEPSRE